MFGILGQGEDGSHEDPHMLFKTTGGRLSTHVVKRRQSLEPLDKWRGRSSSVPAHWENKQKMRTDTQSTELSAASPLREDWHSLPADSLHRHVMLLEERLHAGAHEVAELRLQNSTVNRDILAARSQIQVLTEDMRSLQQAQTSAVAVRAHDSQILAVLQQSLQSQHSSLLADLSARDMKVLSIDQETKQVQASLHNLLQQLQNSVVSGKMSVEQVCLTLIQCRNLVCPHQHRVHP